MKAIVTKQNNDGTFDEVGMNNRTVFGPFKRETTIISRARDFAGKRGFRVELFPSDNLQGEATKTLIFKAV